MGNEPVMAAEGPAKSGKRTWLRWVLTTVAVLAVIVVATPFVLFSIIAWQHGKLADEINGYNANEVAPVLPALEAYRRKNGRYPETVGELHPDFLSRLPRMHEHTALLYTTSAAGSQCWLAIAPHYVAAVIFGSDNVREYDCASRTWIVHDYDEMKPELSAITGVSRIVGEKR